MADREYDKQKMLSYMNRKYQEEFSFEEYYFGQAGKAYTTLLVKDSRGRKAYVRIREEKGIKILEDNYMAWILKDAVEEEILLLAGEAFGECKAYYKLPVFVFPADYSPALTAEDFLKRNETNPRFFIFVKNGCLKNAEDQGEIKLRQKIEDFRELCQKKGYRVGGMIFLTEEEAYEELTADHYPQTGEAENGFVFAMDEDFGFRYCRRLKEKSGQQEEKPLPAEKSK